MKLLEALDSLHQESGQVKDLMRINGAEDITAQEALADLKGMRGYRRYNAAGQPTGSYLKALTECAKLISGVRKGITAAWKLQEAMTTSDFPLLFGDLLYRQMLGFYVPWANTYESISQAHDLTDFRYLNLYTIDGGATALDLVKEEAPYPETTFTEGRYQLKVAKYGRRFGISFEMVVNDDMNAFQSRPQQLALGARRTEDRLMTNLYVDASGPHASFYTSGNKNIITGNPPLSIVGLQTAMQKIATQTDSDGEPIVIDMMALVVPPAQEIQALNLINALTIELSEAPGTTNQKLTAANWMKGRMELIVNPYIPVIATSANGTTSWFLFANPNNGQRPALAHGFLRGRRTPQMYMKDPDQLLIGGGSSGVMEGNFDNDGIDYKIRHFFGGIRVDPKMTAASNGSGS